MHYNVRMGRVCIIFIAVYKQMLCMCVCIPALVNRHAKRMRRVVICGLSDSAIFSALSHRRHECRKRFIDYKMSILIFYTILQIFGEGLLNIKCPF